MFGSNLFVVDYLAGTVSEYTTTGATVDASLVTRLNLPVQVAFSGSDLFVTNLGGGTIGEYTTSGQVVNASLISRLSNPAGIAISGSDLFVANKSAGTIGEYTTSGATVNASIITGLSSPYGIAISGTSLFVSNATGNTIGEYTTSRATVNASLISGLNWPNGIALSGSDMFVANWADQIDGAGSVGEYTTSGATVNASVVTGLSAPSGIFLGPVTIGPPTQLVFSQQPSNAVAGSAISPAITVSIEDQNGNAVTTAHSKVTLSLKIEPSGDSFAPITVRAVNGVATFDDIPALDIAGGYKFVATDASIASAKSSKFFVLPGAPAQLGFVQQPANTIAGSAITPGVAVGIEDQFGNLVATDNADVTLEIKPGTGPAGAVLGGTLTMATENGVAIFSDLLLDETGVYKLKATSSDGFSGRSDEFVVYQAV